MLTRRDLLRLGLLGGAAGVLPLERLASIASGQAHPDDGVTFGGWSEGSPATTPFVLPLQMPPVLAPTSSDGSTDYYEITMRPAQVQILPGYLTTIWGYDGMYPGPTIRARQGRRAVVRQLSNVPFNTSVHLHGGHVAPEHDGHPVDLIPPGGSRTYDYPNRQPGATLWYHDHANHITAPNVYRGLAAFYLLEGDDEAQLNLPSGEFDVPLMIQDRLFNPDGSLSYPGGVHGFLGDTIVVNGVEQPRFDVARRRYRLRLLNASNDREYELTLTPSLPFEQIASDVGLLPRPVSRSSIRLAAAERVEVVVDFSGVPLGSQLVLHNTLGFERTSQVMRFDVVRDAADSSDVPASLRPLEDLGLPGLTRTFELSFDEQREMWVINGKGFDPNRFDARPRLNSTEVWRFVNRSAFMHPMHLHLARFRVLDRGGAPPPEYEAGPKDTVAVRAGETVRVLARFTEFTGRYVFHCHRLEHGDRDMMGQFNVVPWDPPSGPDGGAR